MIAALNSAGMFKPPTSPVHGQQYTYQGRTREWDQTIGGGAGGWILIPVSTTDAETASQAATAAVAAREGAVEALALAVPAKDSALDAADRAESGALVVAAVANPKDSKAIGLATTTSGQVFSVYPGGVDGFKRAKTFKNVDGAAVELVEPVSGAEYDAKVAILQPVTERADRSFITTSQNVASRPWAMNSFFAPGDGHYSWSVGAQAGADVTIGALVSLVTAGIILSAAAETVRLRVYRRPTDPSTANTLPGAGANDVPMFDASYAASSLGLVPGSASLANVQFSVPTFVAASGYTYLFRFNYYGAGGVNASGGFARVAGATGWTNERRGLFDNGNTIPAADAALGVTLGLTYYSVAGLAETQLQASATNAKLDQSFARGVKLRAQRTSDGGSWPASDAHYDWAFGARAGAGLDIEPGYVLSSVSVLAELSVSVAKIRIRMWVRPTDPGTAATYPGVGASDVLVFERVATLAELGLVAVGGLFQRVRFALPPQQSTQGFSYLFQIGGLTSADAGTGIGITRRTVASGSLTQEQRGWYDGPHALPATQALAWELGTEVYVVESSGNGSATDTRDCIGAVTATASGRTVTLAGSLTRGDQSISFGGAVTLSIPTTGDEVAEPATLTDRNGSLPPLNYYNPDGGLSRSNVSAVVVKDASTNAPLVLGTDYALEPVNGFVGRQSTGLNRPVVVDFHWSMCRYDLICVHAETMALSVVQGTERRRDAGEFLPQTNSPAQIPLFYARVADGFAVETIPVWNLEAGIHRDLRVAADIDYANQRKALSKIIEMALRGETIRAARVGDSIWAMGSGSNSAPNGTGRDRTAQFGMNVGNDVISQIPLYNHGDGAGQVHAHASHAWDFIRALQELGATVEDYNFCIGGTTSGTGTNNAGDPVLRAAVYAVNPHILLTHYGMNETGSSATEANLTGLFQAVIANCPAMQAVLAVGMPRPGALKTTATMAAVRTTLRATRRAAEFVRIGGERRGAFFDTSRLMDDLYIGALGLSTKELGGADKYHHPGPYEYRVYGAELKRMIKGN